MVGNQITSTVVYTESPDKEEPLVFGADNPPDQLMFSKKAVTNDIASTVINSLKAQIQ